jgi:hypothetical protein
MKQLYDPPLDHGIKEYVEALNADGIETFESCQGGSGHAYPEPTIRFYGNRAEGLRALAVACQRGFPVANLRRVWPIIDGEPTGPWWEMTLYRAAGSTCHDGQGRLVKPPQPVVCG